MNLPADPNSSLYSASPLNGEAATLHEKNPEEYARKVLARHQDIDD
jgi:ubiquitin-protein ligase